MYISNLAFAAAQPPTTPAPLAAIPAANAPAGGHKMPPMSKSNPPPNAPMASYLNISAKNN